MNTRVIGAFFSFLMVVALMPIQASHNLDDLGDLPTEQPAAIRFVKNHPYLSVTTFVSLVCVILINLDPGFREKVEKEIERMRNFIARSGKKWANWCHNR